MHALTDAGHIEPGQKVLVIGASGGVGSYAVQIAKALGTEVSGVASTGKLGLVRSLGAAHVVDYTRDDFADSGRYDLVVASRQPHSVPAVPSTHPSGAFLRQRLTMFLTKQRTSDLERLNALIETGQITPTVERTYSLRDAADALRPARGDVRGKVVISI